MRSIDQPRTVANDCFTYDAHVNGTRTRRQTEERADWSVKRRRRNLGESEIVVSDFRFV